MDDFTVFSDDPGELLTVRERIGAWLREERHLELTNLEARPERTDGRLHYLGYEVTRAGLRLGPKAKGRMPERLGAAVDDTKRLAASIVSYATAWRFGKQSLTRATQNDNQSNNHQPSMYWRKPRHTTRKPRYWRRLSGRNLKRYAQRRLPGPSRHEPPRITRGAPLPGR